jgi:hypothetical protein
VIVRIVIWNLADSSTNVGELRRYLRDESVPQFEEASVSIAPQLARLGLAFGPSQ